VASDFLHKLFTEGLRGELRKISEIDPLPESWAVTVRGDLACKPDRFLQTGPFGSQLYKCDNPEDGIGVVNPYSPFSIHGFLLSLKVAA
jgi:hypothetical protein